jgi:hypothetical protein
MSMKRPGRRTLRARVSLSPSKIPYGGFSPVRLQAGRRVRPSPPRLIRTPSHAHASCSPTGHFGRTRSSGLQPRGPWLSRGLSCPTASSLTMASSEPLVASCRLMHSSSSLCPQAGHERVPNLLCVCVLTCRLPYPAGPSSCTWLLLPCSYKPSPPLYWLGIRNPPTGQVLRRLEFRGCKVRFMLRPVSLLALHRQGLLRSSFHLVGHPFSQVSNMTTRAHSQFPRPDFHRQHTQHYGLRTENI